MSGISCATCEHWVRGGATLAAAERDPTANLSTGTCHLYPPAIERLEFGTTSYFPVTHESRFCGEWSPPTPPEPSDGETVVPFARPAA